MSDTVKRFEMVLRADGLFAAMRWLNDRVPYRYSAVFRFDGDILRSLCLIDKEDPKISDCLDQPITESYCIYIRRSAQRFNVEESLTDKRVEDHSKRLIYQCYYGIPLFGSEGKMLGTVCHFDRMPVRVTEDVATVLDDLAPLIAEAAFGSKRG